jgi:MraZ protein
LVFSGKFVHTINTNGRVSIPSNFRDNLKSAREGGKIMLRKVKNFVQAYPLEQWDLFFNSLPLKTADDRIARRIISASSKDVEIDSNGRILLPPEFRECFTSECVFLGLGNIFEIWNSAEWQSMNETALDRGKLSPEYDEIDL